MGKYVSYQKFAGVKFVKFVKLNLRNKELWNLNFLGTTILGLRFLDQNINERYILSSNIFDQKFGLLITRF